jgi:hypothetical protein
MSKLDQKVLDPDVYPPPPEDEIPLGVVRDWTPEEEKLAKRK